MKGAQLLVRALEQEGVEVVVDLLTVASPGPTAIIVDVIRASDAAIKTSSRLLLLSLAKRTVASCVLSPSSARKTVPNTMANILRSIQILHN